MYLMDCFDAREQLSPLMDGELTQDLAGALRAHLEGCEACDAEAQALAAVGPALRGLCTPAPAGLGARILTEARTMLRVARIQSVRIGGFAPWLPRVAAVLVGAISVELLVPSLGSGRMLSQNPAPPVQRVLLESQASLGLAGSFDDDFLALSQSPESRLLYDVLGDHR